MVSFHAHPFGSPVRISETLLKYNLLFKKNEDEEVVL